MNRLLVCAALALFASRALLGQQDAGSELDRKFESLDRRIAEGLTTAARAAASKGLHEEATHDHRLALGYEPDRSESRRALGYVRKGDSWERDLSRRVKRENEPEGETLDTLLEAYAEHRERAAIERARQGFAEIASWCHSKGDSAGESRAWRRLLTLDPDHARAREALLYERTPSGGWVLVKDALRIRSAPSGEERDGGEVAKRTGLSLSGRATERLVVLADLSASELSNLVRHGEAARVLFHEIFAPAEPVNATTELVFVEERGDFATFIEKSRPEDSPEKRKRDAEELAGAGSRVDGFYAFCVGQAGEREDAAIGEVADDLFSKMSWGARFPWLDEGIQAYFTARLHDSCEFYTIGENTEAEGVERISSPSTWPARLRSLVATGEDPALDALLRMEDVSVFTADHLAKSWSLHEFLLETRREAFQKFVHSFEKESEPLALFQTAFGASPADIDREWRSWALARY